jgi:hypothetical protein
MQCNPNVNAMELVQLLSKQQQQQMPDAEQSLEGESSSVSD